VGILLCDKGAHLGCNARVVSVGSGANRPHSILMSELHRRCGTFDDLLSSGAFSCKWLATIATGTCPIASLEHFLQISAFGTCGTRTR
jgi:hypothetical protein